MALEVGNQQATSGMTKAIYDQIRAVMEPDLGDLGEQDLEEMRKGWRRISFAVASGVISHILSNMEIQSIQTQGDVNATVEGDTGTADPGNHLHSVNLSGTQSNVVFTQSNDGTGLVK